MPSHFSQARLGKKISVDEYLWKRFKLPWDGRRFDLLEGLKEGASCKVSVSAFRCFFQFVLFVLVRKTLGWLYPREFFKLLSHDFVFLTRPEWLFDVVCFELSKNSLEDSSLSSFKPCFAFTLTSGVDKVTHSPQNVIRVVFGNKQTCTRNQQLSLQNMHKFINPKPKPTKTIRLSPFLPPKRTKPTRRCCRAPRMPCSSAGIACGSPLCLLPAFQYPFFKEATVAVLKRPPPAGWGTIDTTISCRCCLNIFFFRF